MKARKIFTIFLAFLFSASAFSANLFERKITNENFQRTVRPQARIILTQFYNLLEKISPEQNEMIAVKQSITSVQITWNSWRQNCSTPSLECETKLDEVHRRLMYVERRILQLQRTHFTLKKTMRSHEADSLIDTIDTLDEMGNQCFLLLNIIENHRINQNLPPSKKIAADVQITKALHFMSLDAERSFLSGLSDELQPHFDFVWNNYLRDLERYVLIEGNLRFFTQRIEDLNLSWNTFFAKMTSENFVIPEGTRTYIQTMHQSWNGILRQL